MQNIIKEVDLPVSGGAIISSEGQFITLLTKTKNWAFLEKAKFTYSPVLTEKLARSLDKIGDEKIRAFLKLIRNDAGKFGDTRDVSIFTLLTGLVDEIKEALTPMDESHRFRTIMLPDQDFDPLVHKIARAGKASALKAMLDLLPEKNYRKEVFDTTSRDCEGVESFGETIWLAAATSGDEATVDLVLDYYKGYYKNEDLAQKISEKDFYGNTVVHYAAESGNENVLLKVLDLFPGPERALKREEENDYGETPLYHTAEAVQLKTAELLLREWFRDDPDSLKSDAGYKRFKEFSRVLIKNALHKGIEEQACQLVDCYREKMNQIRSAQLPKNDSVSKEEETTDPGPRKIRSATEYYNQPTSKQTPGGYQPNLYRMPKPTPDKDNKTNNQDPEPSNNATPGFK